MELLSIILTVSIGSAIVVASAVIAIDRSNHLALHWRWSNEFIGMTLLSIGTSLPELLNHIVGSSKILANPERSREISELVIGANIGSDIFQQNFLLGFVGLLGALSVARKHLNKDMGGLIAAALFLFILSIDGKILRIEGFLLVAGYLCYILFLRKSGGRGFEAVFTPHFHRKYKKWRDILILIAVFLVMAVAAGQVIDASSKLIRLTGISASFFGILILGIASALPEFTIAILSFLKKQAAVSAGVLIGSNITNPTFALGIGALLSTYTVPASIIWYDLPFKIATALIIFVFLMRDQKLHKPFAVFLMLIFIAYILMRQQLFQS